MAFEYLEKYSTFDSVVDMDTAVEQHIQQHYYQLTESERVIVFTLASRSLMYPGASHLKAETIADQIGVSTKTVYRAVKKLVELNIIEKVPGTKLNGIKGASIYRILPYVPTEVSERTTADEANNDTVSEPKLENQSSNSFNLFSKTGSLQEIYNNAHAEKEATREWMNEWQQMLYDFMHSLPLVDQLKDELYKIVIASEIDSVQAFHVAKETIFNIARDIDNGTLTVSKTLRAVFVGAYNSRIERSNNNVSVTSSIEHNSLCERPVPLYNWLDERESYTTIISDAVDNKYIPNWLDW